MHSSSFLKNGFVFLRVESRGEAVFVKTLTGKMVSLHLYSQDTVAKVTKMLRSCLRSLVRTFLNGHHQKQNTLCNNRLHPAKSSSDGAIRCLFFFAALGHVRWETTMGGGDTTMWTGWEEDKERNHQQQRLVKVLESDNIEPVGMSWGAEWVGFETRGYAFIHTHTHVNRQNHRARGLDV